MELVLRGQRKEKWDIVEGNINVNGRNGKGRKNRKGEAKRGK